MEKLKALKEGAPWDFVHNDNPKCPHCGNECNVNKLEWFGLYSEEEDHNFDCPSCHLNFHVSVNVTYSFSTGEQEDDEGV